MAVTSFESGSASMLTRAIATDRRITFKASSVMPHSTFLHMKKSSSLQDCMRSGLTSAYAAAVFRCRIHHFTFCQGRSAGGDETLNQVLHGAESLRHVSREIGEFCSLGMRTGRQRASPVCRKATMDVFACDAHELLP